jgi:hypothetical protein
MVIAAAGVSSRHPLHVGTVNRIEKCPEKIKLSLTTSAQSFGIMMIAKAGNLNANL